MADIFQEVDEALKQERLQKFWKENGAMIIAAVVIIIVATAASSIYRSWDRSSKEAGTDILLQALEADNPAESLEQAADSDLRAGQETVALLMAAAGHLENGRREEALRIYKAVSAEKRGRPDIVRDYAALVYGRLLLEMPSGRTVSEDLHAALSPVIGNPDSPWQGHALLQSAVAAARIEGDFQKAADYARQVATSPLAPETLKNRAGSLGALYALRAGNAHETDADTSGEDEE